jgi:hypothetical protein
MGAGVVGKFVDNVHPVRYGDSCASTAMAKVAS